MKLIDIKGLQEVLNVGRSTAYSLIHQEGFPTLRIGRRVMIPEDALKRWIEEHTGEVKADCR